MRRVFGCLTKSCTLTISEYNPDADRKNFSLHYKPVVMKSFPSACAPVEDRRYQADPVVLPLSGPPHDLTLEEVGGARKKIKEKATIQQGKIKEAQRR